MSGVQDKLTDLVWKTLDPDSWMASQMDAFQRGNPSSIRSDSKAGPNLTDRMMQPNMGLLEALDQRNIEFENAVDSGPMTGSMLDAIMQGLFQEQKVGTKKKKGAL